MDKLDFKIIKKLIDNSRIPFNKISNELGVSTDTIIRRYNKLKEMGVIKPAISIDIFKLGYNIRVWYMISVRHQIDISVIIEKLAKITDVVRVIKAFGDYDLLVIVAIKDFKHMFEIGRKLKKINGVINIEAHPYLPITDPHLPISAPYGFFNPDLLNTDE